MKRFSESGQSAKKAAGKKISTETLKFIIQFLEEDLAPGMNDTKTYRKDKKRKCYLRDTLFNLHKKYNY